MTKDNNELTAAGTVPVLHRILFSPGLMVIRNGNHEHLIAKVVFFIFIRTENVGFHRAIFRFENLPPHNELCCSGLRAFYHQGAKIRPAHIGMGRIKQTQFRFFTQNIDRNATGVLHIKVGQQRIAVRGARLDDRGIWNYRA
jgi:hypothetical protein